MTTEVTAENVDQLLEEQKQADIQQEAPKEPEVTQEAPPEEKKHDGPEPKVPLGALHEERMRRKAAEAERQELRRQLEEQSAWRQQNEKLLAERLAALQPRQQIDPAENPVGYLASQQAETQRLLEQLKQEQTQQAEHQQRVAAIRQFEQTVKMSEEHYAKEKPDYLEAVKFAKDFKAKEYMTFGYSEQDARALTDQDAFGIAQRALSLGENPAELAYRYALAVGYKPAVNAETKLNMMEAGQKASKPSGGSGKSPTLTLEDLAAMSSEDFARATSDDAAFRKLMGG